MKKEIVITPEDLQEIESLEAEIKGVNQQILRGELKKVFDMVKARKLTTYRIVTAKLGITARSARNFLEALREKGLVKKQYEFIMCSDSVKRKTAIYYAVKESGRKRNK